jgi:hypothetical protein
MYDFLLFVHVLAAFMLMVTVVMFTAFVFGAPSPGGGMRISGLMWDIGGMGTLIFGIWLALNQDYSLLDGWILGAFVLWIAATMTGLRARWAIEGRPNEEAPPTPDPSLRMWHWLRVAATIGVLILMIFKPGA